MALFEFNIYARHVDVEKQHFEAKNQTNTSWFWSDSWINKPNLLGYKPNSVLISSLTVKRRGNCSKTSPGCSTGWDEPPVTRCCCFENWNPPVDAFNDTHYFFLLNAVGWSEPTWSETGRMRAEQWNTLVTLCFPLLWLTTTSCRACWEHDCDQSAVAQQRQTWETFPNIWRKKKPHKHVGLNF